MFDKFEDKITRHIQSVMQQDLAHDLNHVLRVVKSARALAIKEGAQLAVVLPAAYLHDCFSFPKNNPQRATSSQVAAQQALQFLESIDYPREYFDGIRHAIEAHSFSAGIKAQTLEAKIVQDADRLDALGAIGVTRCIQVSATFGSLLYDPSDPFAQHRALDDRHYTIDHFYVKLLKIKETMHTETARAEAEARCCFMQGYLTQLAKEI